MKLIVSYDSTGMGINQIAINEQIAVNEQIPRMMTYDLPKLYNNKRRPIMWFHTSFDFTYVLSKYLENK